MDGHAASMAALRQLRADFAQDHLQYPDLFYAILHGEAFKRGGVAFEQRDRSYRSFERYVMDHVAGWQPYTEAAGYKYPRYFFFGADAIEGARRLAVRCRITDRILRDGLDLISFQSGHKDLQDGKLGDHGYISSEGLHEHQWVHWIMEVGRGTNHPLLQARREKPEITEIGITMGGAKRTTIMIPALRSGRCLNRYDEKGEVPEWAHAMETAGDGWFEGISLFETPIFYASTLMVDWLLERVGEQPPHELPLSSHQKEVLIALLELKAFESDRRVSTDEMTRKAAGPAAGSDSFKSPVASLVAAGLVASKEGRGGGIWLTPARKQRAEHVAAKL
jgi:hypothetical protein